MIIIVRLLRIGLVFLGTGQQLLYYRVCRESILISASVSYHGQTNGEGARPCGPTGSLSQTLGSVPCECMTPQIFRAYSVNRKVRDVSTMMVS